MARLYRMKSEITVAEASEYLGCSTRRVRALLSQGRMTGHKQGLIWVVSYPIQCTVGQRGPLIKLRKERKKSGIKNLNLPT